MRVKLLSFFRSLGPGLLFAGAAIGVSHLVQSTRAGADFGFGLIWALLIVNLFKYPFMQFGLRYAMATGDSLIDGYNKLGKGFLWAYFAITFLTMFTIQAAVTIVTAGLAANLFGVDISITQWSMIITLFSLGLLLFGKYNLLDKVMKLVVLVLTICTIVALGIAYFNYDGTVNLKQVFPEGAIEISFLITFLGWMPAPLDVSVWQSLWTVEKRKSNKDFIGKRAFFDFNIGYVSTVFLGICFLSLGALVMYGSEEVFSSSAGKFSQQLINLYTKSLGKESAIFISLAAFTTMFSTTLTTLDASPRSMARTTELLFNSSKSRSYLFWILFLVIGTMVILNFFLSNMATLIQIATILSFLTAPFYAICNYVLIKSKHTPTSYRPGRIMHVWSVLGILFLIGFGVWYVLSLF
ncbi:Nramp family divalent metal transporter [Namhaeicola litoreus]|uniref:Nramp family divalent metal transporter n=1 Tax=Namhaeicola litoreus TaxID=1052145 RepID=A0ABW3Y670_9FLAO